MIRAPPPGQAHCQAGDGTCRHHPRSVNRRTPRPRGTLQLSSLTASAVCATVSWISSCRAIEGTSSGSRPFRGKRPENTCPRTRSRHSRRSFWWTSGGHIGIPRRCFGCCGDWGDAGPWPPPCWESSPGLCATLATAWLPGTATASSAAKRPAGCPRRVRGRDFCRSSAPVGRGSHRAIVAQESVASSSAAICYGSPVCCRRAHSHPVYWSG